MKRATVTAIVPTFNRAHLLKQTVSSLLVQTRVLDRIIVVDDGSTDETAETVRKWSPRVEYLHQINSGKAAALNLALAQVSSDYVWLMDDDDIALPSALDRHLAFLESQPDVDFSYSACFRFEGLAMPDINKAHELDDGPPEPAPEDFLIWCLTYFPFFMQSMLVPTACYREVGDFDTNLPMAEDYDMIIRLARRYRGGKLAEPSFLYRTHDGARGPAAERTAAADRHAKWRDQDLILFSKIRRELSLSEFLPRGAEVDASDPRSLRRALLQRACVMSRRGLYDEALDDIDQAVALAGQKADYHPAEHAICTQMFNIPMARLDTHPHFIGKAGRLLRRNAPALLPAALKGHIWSCQRAFRQRNYQEARQLARNCMALAGPVGLPRSLVQLVRERAAQ